MSNSDSIDYDLGDIASIPTNTLLKLIESRSFFNNANLGCVKSNRNYRLGESYSGSEVSQPNHLEQRLVPYNKNSSFSADLEALDWTLKEDLLQLRNSYAATFDAQRQQIKKVSMDLEKCQQQLRSKTIECEKIVEKNNRDEERFKQDLEQLWSRNESMKKELATKDVEILSLNKRLEKNEIENKQLIERLSEAQLELKGREKKHSIEIEQLQEKVIDRETKHAHEVETLIADQNEKLSKEIHELKRSMRKEHENEIQRCQRSFDKKRESLEYTISDLSQKLNAQMVENRMMVEKIKNEHDRNLMTSLHREKDRLQNELHDLERSMSRKHEIEIEGLRQKQTTLQKEADDKNEKLRTEIDNLKSREKSLVDEIERVNKYHVEEIKILKTRQEKDSEHALKLKEDSYSKEMEKVKDEVRSYEEKLQKSDEKLSDIKTKFVLLEKQFQKLELRTINSIEKTSGQLLKTLGVKDPRLEPAGSVASALEYLRWCVKETIDIFTTNKMLVLDICDKWKNFQKEKSSEVKKLRERFDHETEDLYEFSRNEIEQSYKQNLSNFNS